MFKFLLIMKKTRQRTIPLIAALSGDPLLIPGLSTFPFSTTMTCFLGFGRGLSKPPSSEVFGPPVTIGFISFVSIMVDGVVGVSENKKMKFSN